MSRPPNPEALKIGAVGDEVLALYAAGMSTQRVGEVVRVSGRTIKNFLKVSGIPVRGLSEAQLLRQVEVDPSLVAAAQAVAHKVRTVSKTGVRMDNTPWRMGVLEDNRDLVLTLIDQRLGYSDIASVLGWDWPGAQMACVSSIRYFARRNDRVVAAYTEGSTRILPADLLKPDESGVLSPALSYFLGAIASDGAINKDNQIIFSVRDLQFARLVQQCAGGAGILKSYDTKVTTSGAAAVNHVWYATATKIMEDLAVFGLIPRKSYSLPFPDPGLLDMRSFLLGYWDGDGSWYVGHNAYNGRPYLRTSVVGASLVFMQGACDYLKDVTLSKTSVATENQGRVFRLQYGVKPAERLARWLYESPISGLQRKREVVLQFTDLPEGVSAPQL